MKRWVDKACLTICIFMKAYATKDLPKHHVSGCKIWNLWMIKGTWML